jgi:multidrug efflux pump subunit AcrB
MLADTFIRRPRLAGVISIVLFLAGLIALMRMPVEQFPDIVPPQVRSSPPIPARAPRWSSRPSRR